MKCEIKYLDINGNLSETYYNNVDRVGEEEARRMYLEEMGVHAFAKLQKTPITDADLLSQSSKLRLTEDEKYYRVFGSEKNLERATSFISLVQDGFQTDKVADEVTRRDIAKDILSRNLSEYGISPKRFKNMSKMEISELPGMDEKVDAFIVENPAIYQRSLDNLKDLWKWKQDSGTEIHKALEWYVQERNKVKADEDGDKDYSVAKKIALDKISNSEAKSGVEDYSILIDQIEEFLSSLGSDYKFETEVKVFDEELGIAGTIDLLAFDGQGNIRIYDYKTKEINKEHLFDYQGDIMMKEPLGNLHDNKANLGALQTSLYRLILERQGRKVRGAEIIYIEAEVKENERGEKVYKGFKKKNNKILNSYRSELGKMFKKFKDIDIDRETRRDKEEGKINDSSDIIYELAGKNDFNEFKDIEASVLKLVYDVRINDRNGKEYFSNRITGKPEYFKSDNIEDRKRQVREYLLKMKEDKDKLASNFMKFFYGDQNHWPDGSDSSILEAKKLLGRVNKDTHDLQQLKNDVYGFEDANPNILIARNKKDGSARIIFLGGVDSHNIKFNAEPDVDENGKVIKKVFDSNARTTIAGNILSDKAFKKRFGFNGLSATDNNFKSIQAGIIAIQLQKNGHISGVEAIVAGSIGGNSRDGKGRDPLITSMNILMPSIKAVVELTKDKQSNYMKNILNNRISLSSDTYNIDYRQAMLNRITDGFMGIKGDGLKKDLERNLSLHIKKEIRDSELLKSLILTQNALAQSIAASGKATSKEDLARDEEYLLLSNTIAQVADINMSIGSLTQKLGLESKARTTGRIASEAIRQLDSKVKSTELAINKDFKEFHSTHSDLVKKLIQDAGMSGVTNIDMHEVFLPLYRVDPNKPIDSKKTGDMFHLKDPNDRTLTKNQSNYIKFFNEQVLNGYGYIFTDKRMEGLKDGNTWEEGRIPLMSASEENKISRDKDRNAIKELTINNYTKKVKKDTDKFSELNTRLFNDFNEQARTGFQGGGSRRSMLGLGPDGSITSEPKNLETNLESILNRFMAGNMRSHHYEITLGIYNAMNIIATVDTKENFNDSTSVKEFMDEYIKLIVFNEYDEAESKLTNAVDITQKTMTMLSLGFSPRQIFLEGATNSFASISSMMSQQLINTFGGEKRFGMGDWTKAGVIASTNRMLSSAIVNEFGLYGSDSEALSSKDFMETRKNFWFQSKWAYALNNAPYRMFKTQVFIAELNKKGIMPAIYHVNGVMKYDINKDTRFSSVVKNGKLLPKDKRVTEVEKDQGALLDSFIKDMYQEGNLDENGLPANPLSYKDINAMKHYSMKLFGSVDKDARVLAQKSVWGRMLWKFKNWAIAKKDNWWTTTDGKLSELAGRRIKKPMLDESGNPIEGEFYYEFQDMSDMGVIQVLGEMWDGLQTLKNFKSNWGKLDLNQKDTLLKGLSDLLLVAMLTTIFLQLIDNDMFKKGPGKLAMSTLINSTADLNVFMMGSTMIDSNPFAVVGYAKRTIGNLFTVIQGSATGNFEGVSHSAYSLFGGLGKTVEAFSGK